MPGQETSTPSTPAPQGAQAGVTAPTAKPVKAEEARALGFAPTNREEELKKALKIAQKLHGTGDGKKGKPKPLEADEVVDDEKLDQIAEDALDDDDDDENRTVVDDEEQPGEKAGDEAAPDAKKAEEAKKAAGRLNAAKTALLRTGMKPTAMAKLTDEEVLESGEAVAARLKVSDGYGNELKKLQAQLATNPTVTEPPATETGAGKEGEKKDPPAATAADESSDPVVEQIITKLTDHTGPEAAKLLKQLVDHVKKTASGESDTGLRAARSMLLRTQRKELGVSYPAVKTNDGDWDTVVQFATALADTGRYADGDEDRLFQDAARAAFPNTTENAQRKLLSRQRRAKAGQMDLGGDDRTGGSRELSGYDKAKLAGKLLAQGKRPDTIRKVLSTR